MIKFVALLVALVGHLVLSVFSESGIIILQFPPAQANNITSTTLEGLWELVKSLSSAGEQRKN